MHKASKWKVFIYILMTTLIFACNYLSLYSFFTYTYTKENEQAFKWNFVDMKYVMVMDRYDQRGEISFTEFTKGDVLPSLKKMNDALNNDPNFNYIEIGNQVIELIGTYNGDPSFVSGFWSGLDLRNQEVTFNGRELVITPVISLQVSEKTFNTFNLSDRIMEGRAFNTDDYFLGSVNKLPIILGYEYEDTYNIGDTLTGLYLAKEFEFEVIGFLTKETTVLNGNSLFFLDNCILMPSVLCETEPMLPEDDSFQKSLYSQKNSGYLEINNNLELDLCLSLIEKYSVENDIKYTLIGAEMYAGIQNLGLRALFGTKNFALFSIVLNILAFAILIVYMIRGINSETGLISMPVLTGAYFNKIKLIRFLGILIMFMFSASLSMVIAWIKFKFFFIDSHKIINYFLIFILSYVTAYSAIVVIINIYVNKLNNRTSKQSLETDI